MPHLLRAMQCKAGYRPGDKVVYLRKKQRINWNWIVRTFCRPAHHTHTHILIDFINFWLQHHNYETYPLKHNVWHFTTYFTLRKNVPQALKILRDEQPQQFEKPPHIPPQIVGHKRVHRIFKPYLVQDEPQPKHPQAIRLLLNRKYGWELKHNSPEWMWASSIRKHSENNKPKNNREPAYLHDPKLFTLLYT